MFSLQSKTTEAEAALLEGKLQAIEARIRELNALTGELFAEMEITPEQIVELLNDRSKFSDADWQTLKELQAARDHKVDAEVSSLANPNVSRRHYKEAAEVRREWIPMR